MSYQIGERIGGDRREEERTREGEKKNE